MTERTHLTFKWRPSSQLSPVAGRSGWEVPSSRRGAAEQEHGERDRVHLSADPGSADRDAGGVRAAFGWSWLAGLLEDYAFEAYPLHPLRCQAIASARLKNDKASVAAHIGLFCA